MRSRKIPVTVALSSTKQTSVPHIDGYQQTFAFLCRYCSFTENHIISINIVVNGSKLFFDMKSHAFYNFICHCLAIQCGKFLNNFHIVDILFKKFMFSISQMFWNISAFGVHKLFKFRLNLFFFAFGFKFFNKSVYFFL